MTYMVPGDNVPPYREDFKYCKGCGAMLIWSKQTNEYDMTTGDPIYTRVFHCPLWFDIYYTKWGHVLWYEMTDDKIAIYKEFLKATSKIPVQEWSSK